LEPKRLNRQTAQLQVALETAQLPQEAVVAGQPALRLCPINSDRSVVAIGDC